MKKANDDKFVLEKEYKELNIKRTNLQKELKDWMAIAEVNAGVAKDSEAKIHRLTNEKRDFELLLTRYNFCMLE